MNSEKKNASQLLAVYSSYKLILTCRSIFTCPFWPAGQIITCSIDLQVKSSRIQLTYRSNHHVYNWPAGQIITCTFDLQITLTYRSFWPVGHWPAGQNGQVTDQVTGHRSFCRTLVRSTLWLWFCRLPPSWHHQYPSRPSFAPLS